MFSFPKSVSAPLIKITLTLNIQRYIWLMKTVTDKECELAKGKQFKVKAVLGPCWPFVEIIGHYVRRVLFFLV